MHEDITVRRMTEEDLDQVVAIEQATFPTPWSRTSFSQEVTRNKAARYLVAERNGQILGFGGAWIILDESHITTLAVREEFRGQGLGRLLLQSLMQYAANLGAAYMTLEVRVSNVPAQALYKSFGYIWVGKRKKYYEDNGEDADILVCDHMPEADPDFVEPETILEP